jgi:hypothetical protein
LLGKKGKASELHARPQSAFPNTACAQGGGPQKPRQEQGKCAHVVWGRYLGLGEQRWGRNGARGLSPLLASPTRDSLQSWEQRAIDGLGHVNRLQLCEAQSRTW